MKKLGQYFTRENPRKCVTLTDDSPEWLIKAVRDAHGGGLPKDWVWETCQDTCLAIDEGILSLSGNIDVHAFADSGVDVYNSLLVKWFADMHGTMLYEVAEMRAEELFNKKSLIIEQIAVIQYCAIAHIAEVVLEAARENLEEVAE